MRASKSHRRQEASRDSQKACRSVLAEVVGVVVGVGGGWGGGGGWWCNDATRLSKRNIDDPCRHANTESDTDNADKRQNACGKSAVRG